MLVIGLGCLFGLYLALTLTVEVPYLVIPGTHPEPYPFREYLGIGIAASSAMSGLVFLGLAEILARLPGTEEPMAKTAREEVRRVKELRRTR
jgi:hypothetical protein